VRGGCVVGERAEKKKKKKEEERRNELPTWTFLMP
jgi:hypothetical protein